jgi:nicotinate-nucleotide adenylyltransferase
MLGPVRTGILGGTFDPPHLAHLVTAEVAYRQLGLDRVLLIPAGSPWQKAGREVSSAGHRLAMTRLAVEGIPYLVADEREVHREGPTYTIDTLASFAPGERLVLILGADAAKGLPTWHHAGEVRSRVELAVAPRPGYSQSEVEEAAGGVAWLEVPMLEVSGTMIRQRVASGLAVRFLVPDAVWNYLEHHRLYR